MSYRIFANHAHTYPAEYREKGSVEALKGYMEECGIEKAVAFATFPKIFKEIGRTDNNNAFLYNQIKNDGRFVGFGTVDFERDDIADQVELIASLGFRGIKIHPAAQEINIMGEKACALYEKAQELGLFLSFHTGIHWHRIADYKLLLFDEVAYNFQSLRFSMEHIGGYHFFREALAVMCNNSRRETDTVFAGWTSIAPSENGLAGAWTLTDDELRTVIHQTGNYRSIFGLDFPFNSAESVKKAIARIEGLDIPEEAKEGILGKNLAHVLDIEF